jgi:predicted RNA methylase
MKRKQLEIILSSIKTNPKPKLRFEQYDLDPVSASTLLYVAASFGDVEGKRVIDLGCGTGILSIGAAVLGARSVVGVDISEESIRAAAENVSSLRTRVELISGTIDCIRGSFDTTIMNPPFGSWRKGLDMAFLERAIVVSRTTYSLHKANEKSDLFLHNRIGLMKRRIVKLGRVEISIPRSYDFHSKARYKVAAYLYRITSDASQPNAR